MRGIVIIFAALLTACPAGLGQTSNLDASLSKISAMVKALGQAEKNKDPKALDPILDNSLVYTDWDGTVMNKAEYMAFLIKPARHPEHQDVETITTLVYGDNAVSIGIYRVKGVYDGKPYLRRGRFTIVWINREGTWVCVAAHCTVISKEPKSPAQRLPAR